MARVQTNGNKTDTTMADLTDQIETLRRDLSALTGTISDLGKAKGSALSDAAAHKVADTVESAQEKGADAVEFASARAKAAQAQANNFVHAQPGAALGIAAGIGFLVGMMSTRR